MKFGFLVDQDTTRYCYLRLRRLKAALKDAQIVDALIEELQVPRASGKKKMAAIEGRIEELRRTRDSLWFEVPAAEVLAASIFRARKLATASVDGLFARVSRAQDLAPPLVLWLNIAGLTPHEGGAPGTGRANLVGYRGTAFMSAGRVVGIEAINDTDQFDRALDEMKTSRARTHASYIACTPALAAEFLWAQATRPGTSRWDAEAIRRRLQLSGGGLLIVEGEAVAQVHLPKERKPTNAELTQLVTAIVSTNKGDKQSR